ncbi:exopolysaccharide biosynthesis protein [Teichococcus vastitatis]|uniref:Exopolysaccharide biosynthesis protein n=1 Tax=Teichococcus vastitatis TaxID=2307076 RepID=A0ABS9WA80_9PROT|nr:exopolysaccharide biosynthesis protein [Pseudoroseomonas vastitatis]MCI0756146.1 exopolysaccharide biosynthesis protein [Pseudoroseomonas vastitatis]
MNTPARFRAEVPQACAGVGQQNDEDDRGQGRRRDVSGLTPLLDELGKAGEEDNGLSISDLLKKLGQNSFGPLMLIPALFIISPFSAIVGFDSVMGILIALVAVQMLFGRKHIWLPKRILNLKIGRDKLEKILRFLRPVAHWTDKVIHPRLERLTKAPFSRVIAAICALIGFTMPPLEVIPFSNTAGAAVVSFLSLGITVRDGVLIAVALVLLIIALGGGAYYFLL